MREILGIDVGGTGIKSAIVNVEKGTLITERHKIPTPKPATPEAVISCIKDHMNHHSWKSKPVGIGLPSMIKNGVTKTASNIDKGWIDLNASKLMQKKLGVHVTLVNDADAAGIAEQKFGKAHNVTGLVAFLTLGTGIGSALFYDGILMPNTELGHLKWKSGIIEDFASNRVREAQDLSWKSWGKELNKVLQHLELVVSPDLIILGGGVSKKFTKYEEYLSTECPVTSAQLQNEAGIIGAALSASANL